MMGSFFTREDFCALSDEGQPVVSPFDPEAVQPASVDLKLGNAQYSYTLKTYVLGQELQSDAVEEREFDRLDIRPHTTVFIGLQETIAIPRHALGLVLPRSSVTRLGICISPVYMNPGYTGQMPITVVNNSPFSVEVVPGVRVAQLLCFHLGAEPARSYADYEEAKYRNEKVSPSLMHSDREISDVIKSILKQHAPSIMRN